MRARDAVLAAAADLSVSVLDAGLSTETTIRALTTTTIGPTLIDQGKAPATLDDMTLRPRALTPHSVIGALLRRQPR